MRISSSALAPLRATVVAAQNATVSSSIPQATLEYCTVQAAAANLSAVETEVNDGTLATSNVACTTAEDCLFMDIYVPANAKGKELPVLAGAHKSHTAPEGLYDLSKDFIFVTYNYREGIAGVAKGPTSTHEGGATNAALSRLVSSQTLDQIFRFGGNAEQLFARAYLNLPGKVPGSGHQQVEAFWQNISTTVGCNGCDEAEFYAGHYNWTGPLVITHELHEKNSDVTSGINSTADVADKIRMYFLVITDTIINEILALYPKSDYTSPGLRFSDIEQSFELTSHNLALTPGLYNQTWNAMATLGPATHSTDYRYNTYTLSGDIQTNPVNATTARIMQSVFCLLH
ncbi:hypothetical protein BPOR_0111g00140 [Botrytis porri]|uniref:Uncharacterized protein n=1 Tax=Botrytis porri TaxID=87229 RepID=A0A4Z1KXY1_9HELO|nr:hypothetical protein BPOR_0111g00140 [Botrytis porri]